MGESSSPSDAVICQRVSRNHSSRHEEALISNEARFSQGDLSLLTPAATQRGIVGHTSGVSAGHAGGAVAGRQFVCIAPNNFDERLLEHERLVEAAGDEPLIAVEQQAHGAD